MTILYYWNQLYPKLLRDLSKFYSLPPLDARPSNQYALIDAAQVLDSRAKKMLLDRFKGVGLFSFTLEHGIEEYGPLLISINALEEKNRAHILSFMRNGWTVSYLNSCLSLPELAKHLSKYLNGRLVDGRSVLVRYYDPRLLPSFLECLDADIVSSLMAPIARWAWWSREMKLITQVGPNICVADDFSEIKISKKTQDTLAVLARNDLIRSMVIDSADDDEFEGWLPHAFHQAVTEQVKHAEGVGLTNLSDIYLFVSLSLRIHPNFFSLLSLDQKIEKIGQSEINMPHLVLTITDDEWNALAHEGQSTLKRLQASITEKLCRN